MGFFGNTFLWLVSTVIFSQSFGQTPDAKIILLNKKNDLHLAGKQLYYFEDKANGLTIHQIQSDSIQSLFTLHEKDVFSRPGTRSAFWFKITVKNQSEEDAWLELGSNYAWYIDFYAPNKAGHYGQKTETGTMRPASSKLYDINYFWLPLNVARDIHPRTYYFKVTSGLTFEMPLQVGTIRSLSKNKTVNDMLTAAFIGSLLIMFIYNLFIYYSTKEKIYLFYVAYLLFMGVSIPYANGYPFIEHIDFWIFNKTFWNEYFILWHVPVYFFIGTFCIRYLDLKTHSPKLKLLIEIEMIILVVVFPILNIAGLKFVDLVNVLQAFILLLYFTCLGSGIYFSIKGYKKASFYVFGWTFMVLGAFIFFAVINGFIPYNAFTRNTLYFGVALEAGLFSLALADRLNQLQKENEQIEAENLKITQNQKEVLEKQVKTRTSELSLMNDQLVKTNKELQDTSKQIDDQREKLSELNETKNLIFAILGHDLRSPIGSLKGLIDLIRNRHLTPEEFFKHSEQLIQGVEHSHFMLNNLLQWANTQMTGMSTHPVALRLHPIIEDNFSLLKNLAKNKDITLMSEADPDTTVFADPNHVDLIIRNILANAVKFTKSGGQIVLRTSITNNFCEISVSDTGIGMSDEMTKKLFSDIKSNRTKPGTKGEKGTGLGLLLCKDFVAVNGGEIWVKSKEDEGTTFYFTLPLVP